MSPMLFVVFALLPIFGSAADTCLSPEVQYSVYTTQESTVSLETAFVVEFTVKCKNNPQNLNIYAELDGRLTPASRAEHNSYQVSFSDAHKKFPAGEYKVRFFDEEGYGDLRKAQRSGEDTTKVKSLFDRVINHPGASRGPWVPSEFVAASVAILVWYLAYTTRSKLQA